MLIFITLLAMAPLHGVKGHPTKSNFSTVDQNSTASPPMEPVNRIPVNASLPIVDSREAGKVIYDSPGGVRLPSSLKPKEYRLKIFPVSPGSQVFHGYLEVDLEVVEPTSVITLNSANLTFDTNSLKVIRTQIVSSREEQLTVTNHSLYEEQEVVTFTLEKSLLVGDTITFSCCYEGQLKNGTYGLNQIIYEKEDGTQSRVLATYLQPIGARRIFPCMDEPSLKATFSLQVGTSGNLRVLSNMPVERKYLTENGTNAWYEFRRSVPMSTYLVAFVISDFETKSFYEQIKVWSRKAVLKDTDFASHLAPRCVRWFEDFFNLGYVLPKLDLVTFPAYSVPGMENFGLITTEESSLTTNGKPSRKEWVATVTAHEIAHQWAGNLVTPVWWSQYWLSEGFATYFAALALNELEPSLEAINHMLVKEIHMTLRQDMGERSDVLVKENFNPLVDNSKNLPMYFKGGAVLRMMNSIFGDQLFIKGLRLYFKTFQFKTASEMDLYSTLTKVAPSSHSSHILSQNFTPLPTTLDKIMDTWTRQGGYPLISVTRTPEGRVSVRQEVFSKKNDHSPSSSTSTDQSLSALWWIPISFATSTNPDFHRTSPKAWLPQSKEEIVLEGIGPQDSWVVLNLQQVVYARVNYDPSLWKAIAAQLSHNHKAIHVLNRAQLFEDAYQLFNNGYIQVNPFMDMLSYLEKEESYFPLKSAFDGLRGIESAMRGDVHYSLLKDFSFTFLSSLIKGPFGTSHMENKRYDLIMKWACVFRQPTCTKYAKEQFKKFQQTNDINIYSEMSTGALLCSALEEGSYKDWDFVFEKFLNSSKTGKMGRQFADALPCSKNQTIMLKYMEDIASSALNLTMDEARELYDGLARSMRWNKEVWAFIASTATELEERFTGLPLPFVVTSYDLEQMKFIFRDKLMNSTTAEHLSYFISESEEYAANNDKTVASVSSWLTQNTPIVSQA